MIMVFTVTPTHVKMELSAKKDQTELFVNAGDIVEHFAQTTLTSVKTLTLARMVEYAST